MTDVTNASRTMLMNIHIQQWDPKLCEYAIVSFFLSLFLSPSLSPTPLSQSVIICVYAHYRFFGIPMNILLRSHCKCELIRYASTHSLHVLLLCYQADGPFKGTPICRVSCCNSTVPLFV